jgi:hypothetical protein
MTRELGWLRPRLSSFPQFRSSFCLCRCFRPSLVVVLVTRSGHLDILRSIWIFLYLVALHQSHGCDSHSLHIHTPLI